MTKSKFKATPEKLAKSRARGSATLNTDRKRVRTKDLIGPKLFRLDETAMHDLIKAMGYPTKDKS